MVTAQGGQSPFATSAIRFQKEGLGGSRDELDRAYCGSLRPEDNMQYPFFRSATESGNRARCRPVRFNRSRRPKSIMKPCGEQWKSCKGRRKRRTGETWPQFLAQCRAQLSGGGDRASCPYLWTSACSPSLLRQTPATAASEFASEEQARSLRHDKRHAQPARWRPAGRGLSRRAEPRHGTSRRLRNISALSKGETEQEWALRVTER